MGAESTNPPAYDPAATLLDEAKNLVTGARRAAYGNPEDNFACIAALWTTYLNRRGVIPVPRGLPPGTGVTVGTLTPGDVAVMMILMKVARLAETPGHHDSLVDIAGYAACDVRCYEKPDEPTPGLRAAAQAYKEDVAAGRIASGVKL